MIQALSFLNMGLILWAVWLLGGGTRVRFGNCVMMFACFSGIPMAAMVELWPLLALNTILTIRSAWLLRK